MRGGAREGRSAATQRDVGPPLQRPLAAQRGGERAAVRRKRRQAASSAIVGAMSVFATRSPFGPSPVSPNDEWDADRFLPRGLPEPAVLAPGKAVVGRADRGVSASRPRSSRPSLPAPGRPPPSASAPARRPGPLRAGCKRRAHRELVVMSASLYAGPSSTATGAPAWRGAATNSWCGAYVAMTRKNGPSAPRMRRSASVARTSVK